MPTRIFRYLGKPFVYVPLATGASFAVYHYYKSPSLPIPYGNALSRRPPAPWTPPSRSHMIQALKTGRLANKENLGEDTDEFDLLIVGGGATGAGVAVDAASRGLKVALVERDDFSAGEQMHVRGDVTHSMKGVIGNHLRGDDQRHQAHCDNPKPWPDLMALTRNLFQVNQARPWWGTLSAKGGHGT